MRIVSNVRRGLGLAIALLLVIGGVGCASKEAIVHDDLLTPLATPRPWVPAAEDLAAARLARAA